jgi:hypothetical protein
MKQFFLNMFSNATGTSHKRVLGTIGFISLVTFLFTCEAEHKNTVVSAIEYLTIATVFGTVIEKFVPKKEDNEEK